jgi:hypothetical protein
MNLSGVRQLILINFKAFSTMVAEELDSNSTTTNKLSSLRKKRGVIKV